MHEVFYLNEEKVIPSIFETNHDNQNLWYLYNGASNHMSGNHLLFHTIVERTVGFQNASKDSKLWLSMRQKQ